MVFTELLAMPTLTGTWNKSGDMTLGEGRNATPSQTASVKFGACRGSPVGCVQMRPGDVSTVSANILATVPSLAPQWKGSNVSHTVGCAARGFTTHMGNPLAYGAGAKFGAWFQ